jgi:hypothetical protein
VKVTQEDILRHLTSGTWKRLQEVGQKMVLDAETRSGSQMLPKLGGGTRLMLDLQHRISDDIDLFIRDPQWIGYLTPRLNDRFEDVVANYDEGSSALKLFLAEGEIDFIVGPSLLNLPDEKSTHSPFSLEPIGEVLAKKLFYRGWAMTPRDLFDWWYISTHAANRVPDKKIADLVSTRQDAIQKAIGLIAASAAANIKWDQIKAHDKPSIGLAAEWAKQQLAKYSELANSPRSSREGDGS